MEESSRRSTRAALAPSWSSAETLTLLHQISAVDRDCGGAIIASFQKWKTISSNLSADGVHRSLDQCRRKWNTLLDAYSKVKELGSYWNLDDEIRTQIGVSDDFDLEVFKAMDAYLRKESEEEGERENGGEESEEPDAVADNYIADNDRANDLVEDYEGDPGYQESGYEEQNNHQIVRRKRSAVATVSKQRKLKKRKKKKTKPESLPIVFSEEVDEEGNLSNEHNMLLVTDHQIKPQNNSQIAHNTLLSEEVDEEVNLLNEQKMLLATNHSYEEDASEEEEEEDEGRVLAEKIIENARNVKAITKLKLSECGEFLLDDSRDAETEFIRNQGEQLISCLGELAQAVKQLCDNKHLCDDV